MTQVGTRWWPPRSILALSDSEAPVVGFSSTWGSELPSMLYPQFDVPDDSPKLFPQGLVS